MLIDGQKSRPCIDPRPGIVILDTVTHHRQRRMRMSAEYALAPSHAGIMNGSAGNFIGEAQPARVRAVEEA